MSTRAWRGEFDARAAAHLWRRAGFGADRDTIARSLEQGLDATLAELFARREHDSALTGGIHPLLALEELAPVQAWWMALILANRAPLVERIALMWHDHFATSNDKVADVRLMHGQIELFRRTGLGDFRVLLHALAEDPAMLVWLDGNANRKGQPNENFAREVMELFALGIGNYSERDIQEAARSLTGWGVDSRRFVFREQYHDRGTKDVLGKSGDFGGKEVIDIILAQPACARHVAKKLLEEFVVPRPAPSEIEDWAAILQEEDWNIERTLERLLRSELFFSPAARRSRIAAPVELVAITILTLGAHLSPAEAARSAEAMGQSLLRPPSVKGWDGGRTWIHAGSWITRHNLLTGLAYAGGKGGIEVDLARAYGHPSSAGEIASAARELLLPDVEDPRLEAELREAAEGAGSPDRALERVTALVLTAPEYHLV